MARYTKEQIAKWNEKMGQNFRTDIGYLAFHNEKTPFLMVAVNGQPDTFIRIHLMYTDEYENYNGYRRSTGRQIPVANVTKDFKDGKFFKSYGLGKWITIGEPQNRKNFSLLQKLTHTIDVAEMCRIGMGEPNTLNESKLLFG